MNRGVYQGSLVQQMVGGSSSPSWWSMSNLRPNTGEPSPLLYPNPPFSSALPQPLQPPNSLSLNSLYESQELPQSWSQLLLGGLVGEEERYSLGSTPFKKTLMNWEDQLMHQPQGAVHAVDHVKQENSESSAACYAFSHESNTNEIQAASGTRASWSHILPSVSSPISCVTSSLSNNILDFSNNKVERRHLPPDHASECNNSIETALKKARVQGSSSSQSNTFKVRKEKLGDRITALHQLVSPFGKTDTASVLLEAIGYIRFLQNQIEALSSPYLTTGSGNMRQLVGERSCIFPEDPGQLLNDSCMKKMGRGDQDGNADQPKKDLRSRGLCLVPVSCTMHVGSEDGTDYWSPSISGGFR